MNACTDMILKLLCVYEGHFCLHTHARIHSHTLVHTYTHPGLHATVMCFH